MDDHEVHPVRARSSAAFLAAAILLLTAGVLWTAWLSDDSFITFRCMDHFVHGRGLGWNVSERVQAFTNPLWLLLLAPFYAWTGNVYWVAMGASFLATAGVVFLLSQAASRTAVLAFGVLLLAGSKAFVEYSTSGLENPLLHVALLSTLAAFLMPGDLARRAGLVALGTSVAFLTRPDSLILTGVLCVAAWLSAPTLRTTSRMFLGWLPALAWEAFSLVYFGTWVPNTAIAKLAGAVPRSEMLAQGVSYLDNSWTWDPLTLTTIAAAVVLSLPRPGLLRRRESVVALALVLHIAYVVWVGGDFMSGRFLTGAFAVSVGLIVRTRPRLWVLIVAAVVAAGLGTFHERSPWRPRADALAFMKAVNRFNISDERTVYYGFTGLMAVGHPSWGRMADGAPYPPAAAALERFEAGERVQLHAQVGQLGYFVPPDLHIVDILGLGEPLLARLPLTNADGLPIYRHKLTLSGRFWRIGHLRRNLPTGYLSSLTTGVNRIQDPHLARFYGAIRTLTRDPIWSRARWKVLLDFHRGAYSGDLAEWRRAQPPFAAD